MARARNIKPGFFTNEDLVELTFATRLLFAGLWTLADREGRLEDRPKKIKIGVFPADDVNVDAMLQELHDAKFVQRYEVNGVRYVKISNWYKHQNPHHTEKPSVIPDVNGEITVKPRRQGAHKEVGQPYVNGEITVNNRVSDGGNLADSLIPDSLIQKNTPQPPTGGRQRRSAAAEDPAGFVEFWSAYPRKVGKDAARTAFAKRKPDADLLAKMLAAVAVQSKSAQWQRNGGQFIPHPSTWLNEGRWNDGEGAGQGESESRPRWALEAGFANRWEAENERCFAHNAHLFRNGRRVEVPA